MDVKGSSSVDSIEVVKHVITLFKKSSRLPSHRGSTPQLYERYRSITCVQSCNVTALAYTPLIIYERATNVTRNDAACTMQLSNATGDDNSVGDMI